MAVETTSRTMADSLRTLGKRVLPEFVQSRIKRDLAMRRWSRHGYAPPSPTHIKLDVLLRNGMADATWVETGTYLGDTTAFLAKHSRKVYSIEPEPTLFANAIARFSRAANVEIINGLSEAVLPRLLPSLSGNICFWLDGHYSPDWSADVTHRGPLDTPVQDELNTISSNAGRFASISVMIDDVRCFNPKLGVYGQYPSVNVLVEWARKAEFEWHIEHDIFVAKNF
jgi:hypothetical protein